MPFLYVYSPSDFVGGLPDEHRAAAKGKGEFELTLSPDAKPTLIEITDDDAVFDEVDSSQKIGGDVDLDGKEYSEGTTVHSAYDLLDSSSGMKVTSLHFGGDGYEQGAVHGLVSNVPMEAGKTYSFNVERTSHKQDNQYSDYAACFASETLIQAVEGDVTVADLKPGDLVATLDGGLLPVLKVLSRSIGVAEMAAKPNLRPVRITAGAMGQGLPKRDLLVSPQHRMLVSGPTSLRMFGEEEALISARKLTVLPGVYVDNDVDSIPYVHLVFDTHPVVFAEGAPSESFFLAEQSIGALTDEAREELIQIFPDLEGAQESYDGARLMPIGKDQALFVEKLRSKARAPLATAKE
mgnify:CR=1 FL=1